MKDSSGIFRQAVRLGAIALVFAGAACAKSNKPADVAQDSILVKDADVAGNKSDTAAAATAALVRERGSAAELPALTSGAPVTRPSDVAPPPSAMNATPPAPISRSTSSAARPPMAPPRKVYPSPVMPPRESTSTTPQASVISSPTSPPPVTQPPPVSQPVAPQPPPVSQPTPPTPKKDSTDSLSGARVEV